ncbi:plastid transcriptionally active 3 [Perilla frutescens var. hirtella]|uniref:Plastid transcriptionally active 3 n=1 Tax=Perilla frutescens var. hirtella TaxID=608512 RepID=A0AAD4JR21_PERFH|nr:plastid transcriptionally active 3 [Perilla frutescens var. hirtella]
MAFSLLTQTPFLLSLKSAAAPRNAVEFAAAAARPSASISTSQRKPRRKKQQNDLRSSDENGYPGSEGGSFTPSSAEKLLRLVFMEELMERSRSGSVAGVSDVIYDMIAAGLTPGPRSFHGLVVSHVLNRDEEGAMHALRRELSEGLRPLHETFIALVRLFGSKGRATRGLEILAAMEKLNYDIRQAWLLLVEELVKSKHLEDANRVFLKGAEGGLRATDQLYDLLIEEDCKVGDHSNALTIAYEMESAGRMATTFHFNCLLSVQATCGIPEIAYSTFENMEYGEAFMKPDTETYNWVIQAYTRAESYDRVQDVAELLGMMVEDHKRLQPNVRTYALLVECFTKYCVTREAIRHFRALKNFEGGTVILHNEGQYGDPLSLYLRALCREGRSVELLEALETMAKDKQQIPPRAMILSRKYRTLVSSWIEPLQEEAELGHEIDYVARYIEEGGLTGERKRWVPRRGKTPLDPDAEGFAYSNPMETSFKQRCLEEWKIHHRKLLKTLRNEGPAVLGNVSESDYIRVEERLRKIIKGPEQNTLKPKAASKMIVSELKEELEAQGLPIDGTRNVLYQRVQKARRINRSRGRPLWVPPVEEEEEEVDEELDELISRIKLEEGNTEFWRRRFLGEGLNENHSKPLVEEQEEDDDDDDDEVLDVLDDADSDVGDEVAKDDEVDEEEEEEEVEQTEIQVSDRVKDKEAEAAKPPQMIGVQLLKDSDQSTSSSRKLKRRSSRASMEDDDDDDWFPEDIHEAFKELRNRKVFDASDMYTLADAWGWTWDKEYKNKAPRRWSQEWEVEVAIKIMNKVIELGGTPTLGDCAMVLRAAIRAPMPSAFLQILQTAHGLGYVFGSALYDEVISTCLDLGELDASIAIVADLETSGIKVEDETLDRVISARQDNTANDASL